MSEPIPEAIPTSADPRSRRPIKRIRTGKDKPTTAQADEIENLMWDPSRPITLPAMSSETKVMLAPPPEIVANVQGSSAGAGSGEFHVYKASRRREYERLKTMDEEAKKEEDDAEWEQKEKEKKIKDEERTRKNREKRNKKKNKGKNGTVGQNGTNGAPSAGNEDDVKAQTSTGKKTLQLPKRKDREGSSDFAVAEVIKENGITIHDED